MSVDPKKLKALVSKNQKKGPPPKFGKSAGASTPPPPDEDDDPDAIEDEDEPEADQAAEDAALVEKTKKSLADDDELDDDELDDLMADFDSDEGVPDWASAEMWDRAVKAVDPEDKNSEEDDPWRLVAYVYKAMGGKILDDDEDGDSADASADDGE